MPLGLEICYDILLTLAIFCFQDQKLGVVMAVDMVASTSTTTTRILQNVRTATCICFAHLLGNLVQLSRVHLLS